MSTENPWPLDEMIESAQAEPAPAPETELLHNPGQGSGTLEDIDTGRAFHDLVDRYVARIRQLKGEAGAFRRENDQVVEANLLQNLELYTINQQLAAKVEARTRELEVSNAKLLTTNHRLEEKTHELQQLQETKEALTHMIAHDMKNPLTAMLGTLRLFKHNQFQMPEEIHQLLLHAGGHGQRILAMIEEMLIISRMRTQEFALKLAQVDVMSLAQSCLTLQQERGSNKNLTWRLAGQAHEIGWPVDPQVFERILNNLLNNAGKYALPDSEITLALAEADQHIVVSVTNWGEPIPQEQHEKIFGLFSRVGPKDTQFSGTGLGLAFCQMAVEAHGGAIQVISPVPPENSGVCFQFRLPKKKS